MQNLTDVMEFPMFDVNLIRENIHMLFSYQNLSYITVYKVPLYVKYIFDEGNARKCRTNMAKYKHIFTY